MTNNPYAPPSAHVAEARSLEPPPKRPRHVVIATILLWVSLALSLPAVYMTLSRSEFGFHPASLGIVLVLLVFAAVLNIFIYRGHNWARIVTLILTLISLPMYFLPEEEPIPPDAIETGLNVIVTLLEIAALGFLFTKSGASWFKRREH